MPVDAVTLKERRLRTADFDRLPAGNIEIDYGDRNQCEFFSSRSPLLDCLVGLVDRISPPGLVAPPVVE